MLTLKKLWRKKNNSAKILKKGRIKSLTNQKSTPAKAEDKAEKALLSLKDYTI